MKVLIASNAPWVGTGYGNQTEIISRLLSEAGHDVKISSNWGLNGAILRTPHAEVFPAGLDQWAADMLPDHVAFHKPDATILLYDIWVFKDAVLELPSLIAYCPVDHDPIPVSVAANMAKTRHQWAMSKFTQAQMENIGLSPSYMPHMVDTDVYKPILRETARTRLKFTQDQFVVAMVAANKGFPDRKNIRSVIKAWAEFVKTHPTAILFLHTEPSPIYGGVNVGELINFYGLSPANIRLPDVYPLRNGMYGTDFLNLLYNAADCFLLPSAGEGFGVPVIEAQAAGCPVIVSDFTAQTELGEVGYKIPIDRLDDTLITLQGSEQAQPKVSEIVKALEWMYAHRGNTRLRALAQGFAQQYSVQTVWDKWMKPALDVSQKPIGIGVDLPKRISVVTPWRDHPELIPEYEMAMRGAEVIIIDNASQEDVSEKLQAMAERLGGIYIRNAENKWFAEANNQGMDLATGEIILFANNDIRATNPLWLRMVAKQVKDGGLYGQSKLTREVAGQHLPYLEGFCVAATDVTWERLGGWDAATYLGNYWEDNDLSFRASQMGLSLNECRWGIIHINGGKNTVFNVPGALDQSEPNRLKFETLVRKTLGLPDAHIHTWGNTGIHTPDGLLIPCKDAACEDGLLVNGNQTIFPQAFPSLGLVIKDDPNGGVSKIIQHEIRNAYNLDGIDFKDSDIVIDIGAHVGIVSMYLAKKYPFIKVYAYEPMPDNFTRLLENLEANGITNVFAFNKAVSSDGRILALSGDLSGNSGGASAFAAKKGGSQHEAESVTLTSILEQHPEVKLLKMDCEGAEYEILLATGEMLNKVKHLRGEIHTNTCLSEMGYSAEKLLIYVSKKIPDVQLQPCKLGD